MKVLVTGANGFVGSALISRLAIESEVQAVATVRRECKQSIETAPYINIGEIGADTDWSEALIAVDVVVHAAARVHITEEQAEDPLSEFRRVNVAGALRLAQQALEAGVRRFIFVSTIKVNGETTKAGRPFTSGSSVSPEDSYGISKKEAEEALRRLFKDSQTDLVILRPPLVYGPGVKANFRKLMRWARSGVPLPLGAIRNKRSFVALDNLVDLIIVCLKHPAASGRTLLVSDNEDLSTTELLRKIGDGMNKPVHLIPIPEAVLRIGARLIGRAHIAQRLCDSLQIDCSETCQLLGWTPPYRVEAEIRKTVEHFVKRECGSEGE